MCGHDFTSKLARMFQDVKMSDELNKAFLTHIRAQSESTVQDEPVAKLVGFDFHVHVLQVRHARQLRRSLASLNQVTCWPFAQPTNNTFAIPPILERPMHLVRSRSCH